MISVVNTSSTVQLHPTVLDDVTETEFVGIGSNVKVRDVDWFLETNAMYYLINTQVLG